MTAASLIVLRLLGCASFAQAQHRGVTTTLSPAEVFAKSSRAVVRVSTADATGSGVLIDSSGVVATNLHVIEGASAATVTLANGDIYDDVMVVDFDEKRDLLLLKIKDFKLPVVTLGDSDGL